jgi:CRP-like cAMP-binding protein
MKEPLEVIPTWIDFLSNEMTNDFFVKISDKALNALSNKFQYKKITKNQALVKIGGVEKGIYIVLNGCLRSFFYQNEKEYSLRFSFKNDIVSEYYSFMTNNPSTVCIEALVESEVLFIKKEDYEHLVSEFPDLVELESFLFKYLYLDKVRREKLFIALSAKEKYMQLLEQDKEVVRNISIKYIASFIGISPNSLSRIRRELS